MKNQLKSLMKHKLLGGSVRVSDSVLLIWDPIICISNNFSGDRDTDGLVHILQTTELGSIIICKSKIYFLVFNDLNISQICATQRTVHATFSYPGGNPFFHTIFPKISKRTNFFFFQFKDIQAISIYCIFRNFFFWSPLFFFLFWSFCLFQGRFLRHVEVPRPGVELELQLLAYTRATATRDPSHFCDLHHNSRQRRIFNPLSKARG